MATAIASDSSSQLKRLGLSEQEFKRKAELMRLYLQDNTGVSFDEFCKRHPSHKPIQDHAPKPAPSRRPAASESSKNTINNATKSTNAHPAFNPLGMPLAGAPLNPQMFGMMPGQMPHHVLPMPPMPILPGQAMSYYPQMWFNPAGMVPGQQLLNPWAAMMPQAPPTTTKTSVTRATSTERMDDRDNLSDEKKKEAVNMESSEKKALPKAMEPPSTPKTPKRKNADPSPFTPGPAAIFISPPGADVPATPITAALFRPDGFVLPGLQMFPSPGVKVEMMRPSKHVAIPSDDVDPATVFKLPPAPYSHVKPTFSYAALIGQALNAAHRNRACLDHIYLYISTVYPFYKRGEQAWQNSIRHNLSQNSSFTRLKHPAGGQHGEWAIREEDKDCFANGGYVRTSRPTEGGRKRRRKGAFDDDTDLEDDVSPKKKARKGGSGRSRLMQENDVPHGSGHPSRHQTEGIKSEDENAELFLIPTRREVMDRALKTAPAPAGKGPQRRTRKTTANKGKGAKGKKKNWDQSDSEEDEEEEDSEFEEDANSPLFGKGRSLRKETLPLANLRARRSSATDLDEDSEVPDTLLFLPDDLVSSRGLTVSPPLESHRSEPLSEAVSTYDDDERNQTDEDEEDAPSFPHPFPRSPDFMERIMMERDKGKESARRQERFRALPVATLLNLSPMRGISTTPLSSSIRGTGPSQSLDDVMSRFPSNALTRDEGSEDGSPDPREPEAQEDDDREVTPPPLIPNPPWLSPVPATPKATNFSLDEDPEAITLISSSPIRHTSICISPRSRHLHQRNPIFLTPARATGSGPRPIDNSFPALIPTSSPIRSASQAFEPVTPDHEGSSLRALFQTPTFSKTFSTSNLEDELARMNRGDDSPSAFFRRSDLYSSSPNFGTGSSSRWS